MPALTCPECGKRLIVTPRGPHLCQPRRAEYRNPHPKTRIAATADQMRKRAGWVREIMAHEVERI